MRLYSYKMTHDSGFAPNPFGEWLTLATCKPYIRMNDNVEKGTWIAGFSSVALNHDAVGCERLVYLMEVSERLSIGDYYKDSRFQNKIPDMSAKSAIERAGDNIYELLPSGDPKDYTHYRQVKNPSHWDIKQDKPHMGCQEEDISGKYVLIAKTFYYFGCEPLVIPDEYRPSVPKGSSVYGNLTEGDRAKAFIGFICDQYKTGLIHLPHTFDADEKTCGSCAPKPAEKTPKTTCAPPNQNPSRQATTQSR
ncbi:hypothetical protein HCH_03574 [Hahella chejuensis KCTC 2396]|uniref:Nucleotide modification associated domain-containing protein n=1 Tax=Hahella chejuensis (strain KCTC 2396) TaxID=349521 RepID=Q2SGA7_HAHCH|nr:hypothetical protein [Hahella chejuensis]ABC30317.1 hypothetical protein HCH_03574 [Hahella chejuensis KCTC 2396]